MRNCWYICAVLFAILVFAETLICWTTAAPDYDYVVQDSYNDLDYGLGLTERDTYGESPCNQSWQGIARYDISDADIKVARVKHSEHLGEELNLRKLEQLDQSHNSVSGDLSSSYQDLTDFTEPCVQKNNVTGPRILANLRLAHINFQNHNFSYVTLKHFQCVPNRWKVGCACTVGGVVLVITSMAVIIAILLRRSRYGAGSLLPQYTASGRVPIVAKKYSYIELQNATNDFSNDNFLGTGSFGSVYKANFPDGQILAVKNITKLSLSHKDEEYFMDVVSLVEKLRHPNIVTLVGYCVEPTEHIFVYEYVRNVTTLENELHQLNWTGRLKIAISIARALVYLHKKLHYGNLKAANVLLEDKDVPRLSDCGIAILNPCGRNRREVQFITDNDMPDMEKLLNDVSDFGVLLVVLLSGSLNSSREELSQTALLQLQETKSLEQMVDQRIKEQISKESLRLFSDISWACIQPNPSFKKPTMSEVMVWLEDLKESNFQKYCCWKF